VQFSQDQFHRRYLLMLALVQKPGASAGFLESGTLWALIESRDLLNLFTICDEELEPIEPHPFIKISLERILEALDAGIGERRTVAHTLILHEPPNPRTGALVKVLDRIKKRALSFAEFSRRYRKKGWPQLMRKIAKTLDEERVANLAAGMLYMVLLPETTFETLRSELKSLGVANPVEAIERFIQYVSEIPNETFDITDVERAVGRKLVRVSSVPTSFGVQESQGRFLLVPEHKPYASEFVDLWHSATQTFAIAPQTPQATGDEPAESSPETMSVPSHDAGVSNVWGDVMLHTLASTSSTFEKPVVDEEIDWEELYELVKREEESLYVEFKRCLKLDNKDFIARFIKQFIGLANRAQKDNRRCLLIVANPDSQEEQSFLDDASYQQMIESYIRPRPQFTFVQRKYRRLHVGVFMIHPVGRRPFVAAKSILEQRRNKILEGQCFMRMGTRTVELNEDEIFELARELALRYGPI